MTFKNYHISDISLIPGSNAEIMEKLDQIINSQNLIAHHLGISLSDGTGDDLGLSVPMPIDSEEAKDSLIADLESKTRRKWLVRISIYL